jgi:hypothetical protein
VHGTPVCNDEVEILVDAPWFNKSVTLVFENGLLKSYEPGKKITWSDFWGSANDNSQEYKDLKESIEELQKNVSKLQNHKHAFSGSNTFGDYYRTKYTLDTTKEDGKITSVSLSGGSLTYDNTTVSISGTTGEPSYS